MGNTERRTRGKSRLILLGIKDGQNAEKIPDVQSSQDCLNRQYNKSAYLAEGEWNSGDYRSARDGIEQIERNRRIKEEGGEW